MTVQECYAKLDGDYEDVMRRFRSEELVKRFARKFLADGSYEELKNQLAVENVAEAFRAAHTLKGVAKNLSFTRLGNVASDITERLRAGNLSDAQAELFAVTQAYELTIEALREL